jgi:hypothetical protein
MDLELYKLLEECHASQEECQNTIDQLLSHELPIASSHSLRYYPDDITEARTFEEYLEMKALLQSPSPVTMEQRPQPPSQDINILIYIVLCILFGCVYLQL